MRLIMEEYDIGIIGAGPGGISAAVESSSLGAKVLIVEKDEIGGICLNKGCIPTKAYLKSALLYDELKRSNAFGITYKDISFDLSHIRRHARESVDRLRSQAELSLRSRKVDVIRGRATFLDNEHISIGENKIKARSFVIATGSLPKSLGSITADNKRIFYSEDIFNLEKMPEDIVIIGGGPIGCEFASFFSAFGTEVTITEMLDRLLPKEDREISNRLEGIFRKRGIKVMTAVDSLDISSIKAEAILVSIGRTVNICGLGLEKIGVASKDGHILADEYLQTNLPNIFAAGDCLGKYNLAHMASAEGRVAARNALGSRVAMDYTIVPLCVYSLPEVSSVGLNVEEAAKRGLDVRVGRMHFAGLGRAQTHGETEGFVKLVADKNSDVILGAQILGYYASELIGAVSIAIKGKLKIKDLADIVQAHPTFSEGIQEAALGLLRQMR